MGVVTRDGAGPAPAERTAAPVHGDFFFTCNLASLIPAQRGQETRKPSQAYGSGGCAVPIVRVCMWPGALGEGGQELALLDSVTVLGT